MSLERMNSSPEYVSSHLGVRPRLRRRTMSIENTSLTEVITIYEKLKKSRDHDASGPGADIFRPSTTHFGLDFEESDFEESVPLEPFNAPTATGTWPTPSEPGLQKVLDFNKFRGMKNLKYLYYSAPTGLIQGTALEDLKFNATHENFEHSDKVEMNYVKLLKSKQYWLNITDPSEKDLVLLNSAFNVHDLTLRDIREGNTEEKIEVYKHYMFISLRLLSENDTSSHKTHRKKKNNNVTSNNGNNTDRGGGGNKPGGQKNGSDNESVFLNVAGEDGIMDNISVASNSSANTTSEEKDPVPFVEDVDFNILLFSDFIITIHDKNWSSLKDVLGFLNLLTTYGNSILSPDWVLFSIFIELAQDAKYSVNYMEPKILNVKIAETDGSDTNAFLLSSIELSRVLRKNFEYEFEIYKISRFVKPKMNILKLLKLKCNKRLSGTVIKLLSNICSEFEELLDDVKHFSHILERSQDTFLTMASVQQSLEANEMGKVMKRISEVALIFLPVQAIGGFMGMNVQVPFQTEEGNPSTVPFWSIVLGSVGIAICLFFIRKWILNRKKGAFLPTIKCLRCKRRC